MRHIRLGILAGTAVALVISAPIGANANPNYPANQRYRDARPANTFAPADATTRSRVPPRPSYQTRQPDARIISTPSARPAPAPTVAAPSNSRKQAQPAAPANPNPSAAPAEPAVRPAATPPTPGRAMAGPSMPGPAMIAPRMPAAAAAAPPMAAPALAAPALAAPALAAPALAAPALAAPALAAPAAAPAVAAPPAPVQASAPTVASEPVRTPSSDILSDTDIADKVRELIARKQLERMAPRKSERDAIEALYTKNRNAMPLWIASGQPSQRAKDAIAHLRTIDADGLDPADYPVPELSASSVEKSAEAELRFTATLLTYARHAMNGRVHFSRVSPNIEYKENFDAADAMNKIAASTDLRRTLDGFNPQHPGYKALKAKYAEMRNQAAETGPAPIANGPVLKYGKDRHGREVFMLDPRVPQLRERLGLPAAADTRYDRALVNAVAKFQKSNGLNANGQLTAATVAAMNGPSRDKQLAAVVATLERWRWMPRTLGATHVALNIPDFHLQVIHNGVPVWKTRVVVGKPTQATPLLTETMKFITLNPTWNVPQSIIYNELLPIYESTDPNIFARMGLQIERRQNGEIRVFQPPGERNALGRIRFNFPNKFLVYQHDTPEKHYFAHDKRAYSHGCMRVQDPMKYAEVLLSYAAPRGNYTAQNLQRMFGGEERQIDFAQHIPVHISYQTAFVDEAGRLQFRDDVYGLDKTMTALLKGSERALADVSIERPADPNFKPTAQHVHRMQSAARGGGGGGFSLFEQLFR